MNIYNCLETVKLNYDFNIHLFCTYISLIKVFVTGALVPDEFCSNHSVHVVRDCQPIKNWFDENKEITTTEHISACYSANDAVYLYLYNFIILISINFLFNCADFNF